jgi:hypothetical protein
MKVLLNVSYVQEYEIVMEDVDSVQEAIKRFDPSDDLQGAISVGGDCSVNEAIEIVDCSDCGGKGYHLYKNPDDTFNSRGCKTCHGNGYIKR